MLRIIAKSKLLITLKNALEKKQDMPSVYHPTIQANTSFTFALHEQNQNMNSRNNHLLASTLTLFEQMETVINQCHQDSFTQPIDLLSKATIGQHFRHIIEFYQELLNGIPSGIVNYENRKRQILIESSPQYALTEIQGVINQIKALDFTSSLFLHARFSPNPNEESTVMLTSVSRELMYAFDHCIHHLAIINIGLQMEFPYIEIPENLGVAPSTIRYREECAH